MQRLFEDLHGTRCFAIGRDLPVRKFVILQPYLPTLTTYCELRAKLTQSI
jgi:hypothetical protein